MAKIIETNEELVLAQNDIVILDNLINEAENEISLIQTNINLVTEYQQYIQQLKVIRLGLYNLIVVYKTITSPNKEEEIIIVGDDINLIDLANAFYGIKEYWQYIYYYNNLTSTLLNTGDEIRIPDLTDDEVPILGSNEFALPETVNYAIEIGLITENG